MARLWQTMPVLMIYCCLPLCQCSMSNLAASSATSSIQIPLLSPAAPYCFRSRSRQRRNDLVPDGSVARVLLLLCSLSNGDTLCSTHRWLLSGRVIKDHLPWPFPICPNRLFILRAILPPILLYVVQLVLVSPCTLSSVSQAAVLKFRFFCVMNVSSSTTGWLKTCLCYCFLVSA